MKNLTTKKTAKILTPLSAFAAMIALGVPSANAQSVFNYDFPASWSGTGTTVTDLSGTDNGTIGGTISLSSSLPSGATVGDKSMVGYSGTTITGGIITTGLKSLANATVAAAGGFTYDIAFMWDGHDSTSYGHVEKLIDYAGTEDLELLTTASGTATLQTAFGGSSITKTTTIANTTTISANTWYNVVFTFNTSGNSVDSLGNLAGLASLTVNGNLISSVAAVKGNYGDSLDRGIGIGELATSSKLVGFYGDIYNPSVALSAPEPSTTALLGMFGGLSMAWKLRRRKQ